MTGPLPLAAFLPEIVVLAGALGIFLSDALGAKRLEWFGPLAGVTSVVALILVVADLGFGPLAFARTLPAGQLDLLSTTSSLYAFSSLGLIFQAVFLTSAFLVSLASLSRPSDEKGAAIFFGLLLMATLGMLLVALAAELIFLLVAIEVT